MPDGSGDRMATLVGMAAGTNSGKKIQKKVVLNSLTQRCGEAV